MTEQELIKKLQSLKQIKPSQEWVFLTKNQILGNNQTNRKAVRPNYAEGLSNFFRVIFGRQLAYSIAVLLLVLSIGTFAIIKGFLPSGGSNDVSTASLIAIRDNVEEFKEKSKVLSSLAQSKTEDVALVVKDVKEIAKELTIAVQKEPQLAKEIALEVNNNKTYLEMTGDSSLKEISYGLYEAIVKQMIKDLENTTLTESQLKTLVIIKNLFEQEKYTSALESVLLLNASI
ncbi:MAG: hypothetical protein AAB340_00980 [Patescibacteria group bacterium]